MYRSVLALLFASVLLSGCAVGQQTVPKDPNLLATKIIVPHKLIPRESCCPPPEV